MIAAFARGGAMRLGVDIFHPRLGAPTKWRVIDVRTVLL
jgi:hypothetical protein